MGQEEELQNVTKLQEVDWVPDSKALDCKRCHKPFGLFFRRHHCRICGQVFCKNCSAEYQVDVENEKVKKKLRMCVKCNEMQTFLAETKVQMNHFRNHIQQHPQSILVSRDRLNSLKPPIQLQQNLLESQVSGVPEQEACEYFMSMVDRQKSILGSNMGKSEQIDQMRVDLQRRSTKVELKYKSFINQKVKNKKIDVIEEEKTSHFEMDPQLLIKKGTKKQTADKSEQQWMEEWLNNKMAQHLETIVDSVTQGLDKKKWRKLISDYTQKAVTTIKTSSRMLGDSIDFNSFVKIITIQQKDTSGCSYVNGVVFKKDVAHRAMGTDIDKPRILVLANSLGDLQAESEYIDIIELNQQEDPYLQIIRSKVNQVKPNIIFVEKTVTGKCIKLFLDDNITLVTDVPTKMMRMIARNTQTVMCPSTNLISSNFSIGKCKRFHTKKIPHYSDASLYDSSRAQSTTLMFLEGCHQKLGCSVILSGPDQQELKQVKQALKRCLKLARTVILEFEYMMFLRPDRMSLSRRMHMQSIPVASFDIKDSVSSEKIDDLSQSDDLIIDREKQSLCEIKVDIEAPESNIKSPFLLNKHMERDQLAFEFFTLVEQVNQDEQNRFLESQTTFSRTALSSNNTDSKMNASHNSGTLGSNHPSEHQINESDLRKRFRLMCNTPFRQLVKFYQNIDEVESEQKRFVEANTSDITLFDWIKNKEATLKYFCPAEACGKPWVAHTDYYYHGNGCVKIRQQEEPFIESYQDDGRSSEVLVYCTCIRCNQTVISRREMPGELLEMSFYKLLEQFFYNQDLVSNVFDEEGVTGERISVQLTCRHSFHKDVQMALKYRSIKVMFKYEPLDCFNLDLINFKEEKGEVKDLEYKIIAHKNILRQNLAGGVEFMNSCLHKMKCWTEKASDSDNWLNSILIDTHGLANSIQQQLETFRENSDRDLDFMNIRSSLQLGRVKQLVSARVSEFMYLIKEIYHFVLNEILPEFPRSDRASISQRQNNTIDERKIGSVYREPRFSATSMFDRRPNTEAPEGRTSEYASKSQLNPSTPMNNNSNYDEIAWLSYDDLTTEIEQFLGQLAQAKQIRDLVAPCSNIPLGFNQNGVIPDPKDFGSLIATTLNSNLYHNGLSAIDYMDYSSNLRPFKSKKTSRKKQDNWGNLHAAVKNDIDIDEQSIQMELDPKLDVLNGTQVTMQQVEQEMMKDKSYLFCFAFSTVFKPEMVVAIAKDDDQDAKGENAIDEVLTTIANKQREYFSSIDEQGNEANNLLDMKGLEVNHAMVEYDKFNQLQARQRHIRKQARFNMNTSIQIDSKDNTDDILTEFIQVEKSDEASMIEIQKRNSSMKPKKFALKDEEILSYKDASSNIYSYFHDRLDFTVRVYFPGKFEALRKMYCGSYDSVLTSISKSRTWAENSGGKSQSSFHVTEDGKYIFKTVKSSEIRMFGEISTSYFEYLSRSFSNQCPTAIAKILGIFELTVKTYPCKTPEIVEAAKAEKKDDNFLFDNLRNSQHSNQQQHTSENEPEMQTPAGLTKTRQHVYVLMMENLLLGVDESETIKYDLKGSRRNRYSVGNRDGKVTLDNNFLKDMRSRPIPMQYQMRRMLQIAINNDALYLSKHSIIDYSLFVAINPIKKTIRVGIIDYIQHFTFKKVLETNYKQAIANEAPTIVAPDAYKKRFKQAMDKYFIALVPDQNCDLPGLIQTIAERSY